jgi:NAD(P)-dependent dehydrogenase (short-subunit alcohol dehydrogenase family)
MMRILVTGASRGIGLEFTRQLLARGEHVVAAARKPDESGGLTELSRRYPEALEMRACDVTDEASVAELSRAAGRSLDWLVNNAGIAGDEAPFGEMDFNSARRVMEVNAFSPLRVARALLPALRSGSGKKIVHLTSKMGSIADNHSGGWVAYRMSKAALNMASRCLAIELRPQKILSVVVHPGWVKTDMGGAGASISTSESVAGLVRLTDALTPEQSGRFFDFRGGEIPW